MKLDPDEVLSMLIDGESAPGDDLVAALSRPGAATTLLDYARLRAAVATDEAVPSAAVKREVEAATRAPSFVARLRRPWRVIAPAAAIGALAAAVLVLAIRPPGWHTPQSVAGPPVPELVVRFSLDPQRQGGRE